LKTSGVRNSRIEPINDLARRRWRARFLALAICRSSVKGFGLTTTHHCRNGFFMHGQFNGIFRKQIVTLKLNAAMAYNTPTSDADSALRATLSCHPIHE
jgi:hypothetical protein